MTVASGGGAERRPSPTDGELVARVLKGDHEAFAGLTTRHQGALYRHAARMLGSPDVAEDAVQGALIKAYVSLARCREPDRFGSWVFRILSNRCKDYLKSRRRRETSLEESWPDEGPDPAETAARTELRRRVARALDHLPPSQREAFILKHIEGLSYEEIAERLGTSIGSLKMRVFRARDMLQELLEDLL
jgi:RNA polymerase sigma-70 factor (ECF subfamily)